MYINEMRKYISLKVLCLLHFHKLCKVKGLLQQQSRIQFALSHLEDAFIQRRFVLKVVQYI